MRTHVLIPCRSNQLRDLEILRRVLLSTSSSSSSFAAIWGNLPLGFHGFVEPSLVHFDEEEEEEEEERRENVTEIVSTIQYSVF